nr:hypothetical protein 13 [Spirochaetaceae bacterium]
MGEDSMIFIEHDGERITRMFSASESTAPESAVSVPDTFSGAAGMPITAYDDEWNLRPRSELVVEGIIPTPDGFVWDDEQNDFRKMTQAEQVEAGEIVLGERQIVDGDNIRDMTREEMDARGLLTNEERAAWEAESIHARLEEIDFATTRSLRAILAGTDTPDDRQRLADLETEAQSLRNQLAEARTQEGI